MDEAFLPARQLKELSAEDRTLTTVKSFVMRGWPKILTKEQHELHPYFCRRQELTVVQDLLYWGQRVVIPGAAQKEMLNLLHEAHQGATAMKRVARTLFWWPGLDGEVERLARLCHNCTQAAPMPPASTPVNWPETGENWARLHIDFAGPIENKMLLVVVDSHTKWIEVCVMRSATTEATIRELREMFSRFGLPRAIVSDNGTQFTSQQFGEFLERNHVEHLKTAPYHPQSNGLAERAVRTVKESLAKLSTGDLEEKLAKVLLSYRRTPLSDGKSPAERLLGFQVRSRVDTAVPSRRVCSPDLQVPTIRPHAAVWYRNFGQGEKWLPGVVESNHGARMTVVSTPGGNVRRHLDQLRLREVKAETSEAPAASGSAVPAPSPRSPADQLARAAAASGSAVPVPSPTSPADQLARAAVPAASAKSPANELYGDATTSSEPEDSCVPFQLRRSTRTRKPIDRLQL
ncbi:uncharacterized protein K02A2.6-like [Ixodes scapularis]|nr:uncharacterized protein K02A2.6-like [Ixodes scapularis]